MIMLKSNKQEEKELKELSKGLIRKEAEKELINKKGREEFYK